MRQLIALSMCLALLSIPAAGQANSHGDWSAVTSLPAGTSVEVHRQSGGTVSGTVASVSATALTLTLKSGSGTSIDRQAITSVYRNGHRHVLQGAAIGGALGVGTGVGLGAATGGPGQFWTRGQGIEVAAPILGVLGALVGGVIGLHRSRSLVFRAP